MKTFLLKVREIGHIIYSTQAGGMLEGVVDGTLTAVMIFTGEVGKERIFNAALDGAILDLQFVFDGGPTHKGDYRVSRFEFITVTAGEFHYRLAFQKVR